MAHRCHKWGQGYWRNKEMSFSNGTSWKWRRRVSWFDNLKNDCYHGVRWSMRSFKMREWRRRQENG